MLPSNNIWVWFAFSLLRGLVYSVITGTILVLWRLTSTTLALVRLRIGFVSGWNSAEHVLCPGLRSLATISMTG